MSVLGSGSASVNPTYTFILLKLIVPIYLYDTLLLFIS